MTERRSSKEARARRRYLRKLRRERNGAYSDKSFVWWLAFSGVLLVCGVIRYLERRRADAKR